MTKKILVTVSAEVHAQYRIKEPFTSETRKQLIEQFQDEIIGSQDCGIITIHLGRKVRANPGAF